jgi:hypothetical protein
MENKHVRFEERRRSPHLDEETIDLLVLKLTEKLIEPVSERAAEKAVTLVENKIYQSVGKWGFKKITTFIGIVLVAAYYFLAQKGFIKLGG